MRPKDNNGIEITLEHIKVGITVFSALFLCAGVLYNHIYLWAFGIEVSKFFTVQDYLSSSLDKVIVNLISMLVGVFIYPILHKIDLLFTKHCRNLSRIIKNYAERYLYNKFFKWLLVIIGLVVGIRLFLVSGSLTQDYKIDIVAQIIFIGFVLILLVRHITQKYIKDTERAYFIVCTAITYFILMSSIAMYDRGLIYENDISDKNYKVTFHKDVPSDIDEPNLVLLTANSNCYFFFNKSSHKSVIIPAKQVISVETLKSHPTVDWRLIKLL